MLGCEVDIALRCRKDEVKGGDQSMTGEPDWLLVSDQMQEGYRGFFIGNGSLGLQVSSLGVGAARDGATAGWTEQQLNGFWGITDRGQEARAEPPSWARWNWRIGEAHYGATPLTTGFSCLIPLETASVRGASIGLRTIEGEPAEGIAYECMEPGQEMELVWNIPQKLQGTCWIEIRYAVTAPDRISQWHWESDAGDTASLAVGPVEATPASQSQVVAVPWLAETTTLSLKWKTMGKVTLNIQRIRVVEVGPRPSEVAEFTVDGQVREYEQVLDLSHGVVHTQLQWVTPHGEVTDVATDLFIHRRDDMLSVIRVCFSAAWTGQLTLCEAWEGGTGNLIRAWNAGLSARDTGVWQTVVARGTDLAASMVGITTLEVVSSDGQAESETPTELTWALTAGIPQCTIDIEAGRRYVLTKYCATAVGPDAEAVRRVAQRASEQAMRRQYAELMATHCEGWDAVWQSRIEVSGAADLIRLARSSQYYLWSSTRVNNPWSVPATGLACDGWGGRVFWDAETWIYPVLLLTHPEFANEINRYRQRLRPAYRAYADETGGRGYRVPWESGWTGAEQSPYPYSRYELHVTAAVVLAHWQYFLATGDTIWLNELGWPMIREAAEWLVSRVEALPHGQYDLRQVMGPDEYHWPVNDNAFTRGTTQRVLEIAAEAAAIVGQTIEPAWMNIAVGLNVPIDPVRQIHRQYEGYDGEEIKQADVVLLRYPWDVDMPESVAGNDLAYYAPKVMQTGPAMAHAIHAIVAASVIGRGVDANNFLERTWKLGYVHQPQQEWSEIPRPPRPISVRPFLTGSCGWLQALVYGMLGFRWRRDHLYFNPVALSLVNLDGISIHQMRWQGRILDVWLEDRDHMGIKLLDGPPIPLKVGEHSIIEVSTGEVVQFVARS